MKYPGQFWIGTTLKGGSIFGRRQHKWAFNAKPDLVVQLGDGRFVCIEAKLGSGIGRYTAKTGPSVAPFSKSQTELQEFIFNELLRVPTEFVIVSKEDRRDTVAPGRRHTWRRHTWQKIFAELRREPCSSRMVAQFCNRFVQPA